MLGRSAVFAAAVIVLIAIIVLLVWYFTNSSPIRTSKKFNPYSLAAAESEMIKLPATKGPPCLEVSDRTKEILIKAVDAGLQEYVENLFAIMTRDHADQPDRAIRGASKVIDL